MTQHAVLNKIDHRNLRVDTSHGAMFGDEIMSALTFPAEFRNVQSYYPIVFQKDELGSFQPVALFGLQQGQNLFLQGARWDAHYIPLSVKREPFLIGRSGDSLQIHIDLDHPRVGTESGQPLFHDHGGSTEYLEQVSSMLGMLHSGVLETAAYIDALLKFDLLESFVLDIQLDEETNNRFMGFYTINEERLRQLGGDALGELGAAGYLEPTYMAMASLSHLRDLIERLRQGQAYA
jgi:hypothetical protein